MKPGERKGPLHAFNLQFTKETSFQFHTHYELTRASCRQDAVHEPVARLCSSRALSSGDTE